MPGDKNIRMAMKLTALVVAMIALSFAAVPLYDVFCKATGLGGTTQRAAKAPENAAETRTVTVTFNADVAPGLPWEFKPETASMPVRAGQAAMVKFRAKNLSDRPLVGTAVYNVQPGKVGLYFNKVECFCFQEQMLQPGQEAEFPVTFFLDPDMAKDKKLDDVQVVTLSYTFFLAKDQSKAKLAQSNAPAQINQN
ncbi:MAG: cytochrome c oxidase assembly protein [Alphaproteobacteria bacterium]